MARKVMISCAVTGSADTPGKNPAVPVTPEQIANSCLDAAKAGAAIVHIHVRDPKTTKPSMDKALYRETVERIRAKNSDVLINLTTGNRRGDGMIQAHRFDKARVFLREWRRAVELFQENNREQYDGCPFFIKNLRHETSFYKFRRRALGPDRKSKMRKMKYRISSSLGRARGPSCQN